MPPKDKPKAAADKAKQAAKQKVAEDKTFGLKNKNKSAKVQKYVQTVQKQVVADPRKRNETEASRKDKKKAEEEKQKELAALFAVAIKQPKVPAGVDPKSIVCEFYRHGQCTKGFKCKFSHDLSVERKGAKIDLYTDQRGLENEDENMEEWDQETLEKAIKEKHSNENKNKPTEIICKFFLDAVEKRQYGWFWKCPNGGDCKYRHALPPGYVLKSQMKELLEEEAKNKKDVAETIEEERAKVDAKTPITEQVFAKWRAKKTAEKKAKQELEVAERQAKGILNGRELFLSEGFVVHDDAGAADDYTRENDDEADITAMLAKSQEEQARAQAARVDEPIAGPSNEAVSTDPGASSTANGTGSTLKLSEEDKAVFLDDDDDLEEEDFDDGDLDELAEKIKASHVT